jgi:hypothetical protein
MPPDTPPQLLMRKARSGCFGCLFQVGLIFLLAAILLLAATGLFYPWAFYLGGKFHILPMWQGLGRAHTKSGQYLVWIRFQPTPTGSRMYLSSNLTGEAYLCTPRGEKLRMHLGGSMAKHLNLSTDGESISLYMNYASWNRQFRSPAPAGISRQVAESRSRGRRPRQHCQSISSGWDGLSRPRPWPALRHRYRASDVLSSAVCEFRERVRRHAPLTVLRFLCTPACTSHSARLN